MKGYFIGFLILLIVNSTFSQKVSVDFDLGYGIYSMSQLKELNNEVLASLPFPAQTTSSFPPYLTYRAGFFYRVDTVYSIGTYLGYSSTGSRISLADYSGEYRFDQTISAISTGIALKLLLINKRIKLELYNSLSFCYTELNISENLILNDFNEGYRHKLLGNYCSYGLGANFYYSLMHFDIGFYGGFVIDINSNLGIIPNYSSSLAGWTGPRFGIHTAYNF